MNWTSIRSNFNVGWKKEENHSKFDKKSSFDSLSKCHNLHLGFKFKKIFLWQLSRWNFSYPFWQSNELLELPVYKQTSLPILGKHIDASIDLFDNTWIDISVTYVMELEGTEFRCHIVPVSRLNQCLLRLKKDVN